MGSDIWIDPEAFSFTRVSFGFITEYSKVITNMISRDMSNVDSGINYHLSISKLMMDQWEMSTAKINYDVDYLHVMESTLLLAAEQLAWQPAQWPAWYSADYIFKAFN